MKRLATPLMALAIFLLNVCMNAPLFMPGELPFRGSIEGGYVAMARFFSEHPNPWGWNPLQYCGLPAQFMYVPLLPYTAAAFIRVLPHASPDTIYRVIVSLATCAGPVTLFLFAVYFTGNRLWAFATAVAYSLFSPSYGLFPAVEKDRGIVQLPWRIQVLAKYGEGPHATGLTLLPLALMAVWRAAKGGYAKLLLAAVMLALIPLTNWVAAFSLAIACVVFLVAVWGEPKFESWRVFAAAGLAWLLACFWLTPSFIGTIAFNWPTDSFAYKFHPQQAWLLAGMAAGVIVIRLAFRLLRGSFYFCFVTMGAFVFGWIASVYYLGGIDTIPESRRYAIEFEFFLALTLAEAFRHTLRSSNQTVRLCAIGTMGVMFLAGLPQLWAYATQGWQRWRPVPAENTTEYRLARWLADQHPTGRVFASGGLRFRLNSWFDLPQVGGGFETGLRNRTPVDLAYRIRTTDSKEQTLADIQTLGTQYVVVHGPKSKEYYRDFRNLDRLSGLPVAYKSDDDTVYRLPAPAVRAEWTGTSSFVVNGPIQGAFSVPVNWDPGWRAAQDGRGIAVERDELGFIRFTAAAAESTRIEARYRATAEPRIFAAVSAATWIAALWTLVLRRKRYTTGS